MTETQSGWPGHIHYMYGHAMHTHSSVSKLGCFCFVFVCLFLFLFFVVVFLITSIEWIYVLFVNWVELVLTIRSGTLERLSV